MGDTYLTTGFWSRFTAHRIHAPVASYDAEGFGRALMETLEKFPADRKPVVLAMEDASQMWIAHNLDRVRPLALFPLPSLDSLEIAMDKGRTMAVARELGLPTPGTWEPSSPEELDRILNHEIGSRQFVIKPRTARGSAGMVYNTRRSVAEWRQHWDKHGPLLIQERIPKTGEGLGVSLLLDDQHRCVASFSHRRLKQYPVSGGPSTDRESIHAPEMERQSIDLLKRLEWKGIAMVEWKLDPVDNTPKLMEINPRFWGSLELAIRAGVDFPALFARTALGEALGPPPDYPAGVRCRWMIPGDILRYLTTPSEEREGLGEFVKGLPDTAEEWDPQDLRGALATVVCTGGLALNPRYWKFLRRD
jgi:predicted ATP-grasp superfamily ATP-dependent carboligase